MHYGLLKAHVSTRFPASKHYTLNTLSLITLNWTIRHSAIHRPRHFVSNDDSILLAIVNCSSDSLLDNVFASCGLGSSPNMDRLFPGGSQPCYRIRNDDTGHGPRNVEICRCVYFWKIHIFCKKVSHLFGGMKNE